MDLVKVETRVEIVVMLVTFPLSMYEQMQNEIAVEIRVGGLHLDGYDIGRGLEVIASCSFELGILFAKKE